MVSIIITAYNVEKYIEQSIKSALSQTYGSWSEMEVVVVLDKPTDNTTEIVKTIKDSKLRIIENEENVGAGLSRRKGIENALGDWILLLDGDDWLEPEFVEKLVSAGEKYGADIVSGGVTIREESGYYEVQCYGDCITEGYEKISKYWGQKIVFMNNRLIRKSMFEKVPYSNRRYIEDTPTIIPMLWFANRVVYVDEVGYNYRVNPESLTHTSNFVKEFIYKGLCWCDLIEFFNKVDPKVYEHVNIPSYVTTIITQLNSHKFTAEELQPYISEWAEFTMRFFNLIKINGIDNTFKF